MGNVPTRTQVHARQVRQLLIVYLVRESWYQTAQRHQVAARVIPPRAPPVVHPVSAPVMTASAGLAPCGGDLPPCWRVMIESHRTWNAYNPGGCVAHGIVYGCFGPYQFSGEWAGKLGLPMNLFQTTPAQWINAARQLWNGGAGCGNWSACG